MAKFTPTSIDRLRDSIDMVDLVSGHTELRRAGTQYSGRCPFHDERTPSFSVNPVDKVYYCFGCGEGGDAFNFVQKTENVEFPAAVELLAERYGVELELENSDPREEERRKRIDRLFSLVERTCKFYERYLWDSPEAAQAREYLISRGFSETVLKRFRVGFSPSAWDRVMMSAFEQGFNEQELRDAGLGQKSAKGDGFYDRFRGRVMFPLADTRGRVRGFGARALRDSEQPKYLNTSDGPIYRKGRQLFGAHLARSAAAKKSRVIAVEGYADVLALHDAGIEESVAIMGTAITDEQLIELSRLAPRLYLALDADRAGRQAMIRAARVAERHGVELNVIELPPGSDPADVVMTDTGVDSAGATKFEALIEAAVTVLEFEVGSILAAADLASARGRDAALTELDPVFAAASASAVKDEQVRRVAGALELSEASVGHLRKRSASNSGNASAGATSSGSANQRGPENSVNISGGDTNGNRTTSVRRERPDRIFMAMCLAVPDPGRDYLGRLKDAQLSTTLMRELRDWLKTKYERPLEGVSELKPELRDAVTEVAMLSERETASAQAIRLGYLQLQIAGLDRAMAMAPAGEKAALSMQRQQVIEQLGVLTAEFV